MRGLLIATMTKGVSRLHNVLDADDGRAALEVCRGLGAKIQDTKNSAGGLDVTVESEGIPLNTLATDLFASNSGITTTFTVPLIGLRKNPEVPLTLACGEQMQKRPLKSIIEAVKNLGMEVKTPGNNDSCPLLIRGTLDGGYTVVDGQNSQYLSALLLSLPCAPKNSIIEVKNLQERPYVDMTLAWLDEQNIRYGHEQKNGVDTFKIFGQQEYRPFEKTIPGDFSSASYLIAAAVLLPGEITLHGLNMEDPQGDKRIIALLQQMGADITVQKKNGNDVLHIHGGKILKGTTIDCGDIPDMLPTLAVVAIQAEGKTTLMNVGNARIKETDRIASMAAELKKMGGKLEENATSLTIWKSKLYRADLHGYSDHRTIMALAIAGLLASPDPTGKTATTIDTAECIKKTFPNFVHLMRTLGAAMSEAAK
ncbi:MAG: 3-phosphoshikimate 1-carboxyvinyltransferase [Candidatus Gracilibacteria bacterium]